MQKILVLNPGSTSTKMAVYDNTTELLKEVVRHDQNEIDKFDAVIDQYEFRLNTIINTLFSHGFHLEELDFIVARGGLLKPIEGGVWEIDEEMIEELRKAERGEHASNLGAPIAYHIAQKTGIPSFIVDPVVVDELEDIARISGIKEIPRESIFHALNQKATARQAANELDKEYKKCNLIVVHMGGGISVGVHKDGRVIDVNNGLHGEGPFSPERSGAIPAEPLVRMCYSNNYTKKEIIKKIHGKGGLISYINSADVKQLKEEAQNGNKYYELLHSAMAYQISKEIGSMVSVLEGKVDAIVLTGGLAYDELLVDEINKRVSQFGKILTFPGENEMEALRDGLLLALKGKERIHTYGKKKSKNKIFNSSERGKYMNLVQKKIPQEFLETLPDGIKYVTKEGQDFLVIEEIYCSDGHNLIDQTVQIHGEPSIKFNIVFNNGDKGTIYIDSYWGSHIKLFNFISENITNVKVADYTCPACDSSLMTDFECPRENCDSKKAVKLVLPGYNNKILACAKLGCPEHKIEIKQMSKKLTETVSDINYWGEGLDDDIFKGV